MTTLKTLATSLRARAASAGLVAFGIVLGALLGGTLGHPSSAAEPAPALRPSKTVYIDVTGLGKRNSAEKNINELHVAMAAQGFVCSDLTVYTENGDLEGFFVTYRKE